MWVLRLLWQIFNFWLGHQSDDIMQSQFKFRQSTGLTSLIQILIWIYWFFLVLLLCFLLYVGLSITWFNIQNQSDFVTIGTLVLIDLLFALLSIVPICRLKKYSRFMWQKYCKKTKIKL